MSRFLIFLYSAIGVNVLAQRYYYSNEDICLRMRVEWVSSDSVRIWVQIENTSRYPIFIYPLEKAFKHPELIGIGLFSSFGIFAPSPGKIRSHYWVEYELDALKPGEKMELEVKGRRQRDRSTLINLDYLRCGRPTGKEKIRLTLVEYDKLSSKVVAMSFALGTFE